MQHAFVTDYPRSHHSGENHGGQSGPCNRVEERLWVQQLGPQDPNDRRRETEQQRSIGQRYQPPQKSKRSPRAQPRRRRWVRAGKPLLRVLTDAAQSQCQHESPCEEASRKGHLPEPVDGVLQSRRVDSPQPGRPERYGLGVLRRAASGAVSIETACGNFVDCGRDSCRENAVAGEQEEGRCVGIDSKYFEAGSHQQGV